MNIGIRVPHSAADTACTVLAYTAVWFFASLSASACVTALLMLFR
ncbi:hypothetical protein J2X15_000046 [Rhodoferax saidenbachensis]|uniref:Uncharacterized protein n=1 Tax=Rhodoferax saidenbachensis TaxID=1484693 RepID=A0ABU1ZIQ3_9BURK|nr:hypothetical protein [Rhodoferax saidenbachensis]